MCVCVCVFVCVCVGKLTMFTSSFACVAAQCGRPPLVPRDRNVQEPYGVLTCKRLQKKAPSYVTDASHRPDHASRVVICHASRVVICHASCVVICHASCVVICHASRVVICHGTQLFILDSSLSSEIEMQKERRAVLLSTRCFGGEASYDASMCV